jgi:LmbE family N-acetylglucosaminyl deacetylase
VVESEIKTFNPDVIFTHFQQDLNVDHRKSFEAVITACRPTGAHGVKGIYSFEIPSSTGWSVGDSVLYNPNTFVSVSEENLKAKISALECYKFETRDFPHPRSAKGLHVYSQFRGMQCNRDHAEAFIQAKTIY